MGHSCTHRWQNKGTKTVVLLCCGRHINRPIYPLRWKDHYKSTQSFSDLFHLYPMLIHFQRALVCYGLYPISTQLNSYGKFWTNVFDSVLDHYHQNINWGNIFWKNGFISLLQFLRLVKPLARCVKAILAAHDSATPKWRQFILIFPLICHLSVCLTQY